MRSAETTLYVVAYDISNDRRRTRVHKLLCGFGEWTQYSLFECWLTKQQLVDLRARLYKLIEPGDSLRFYPLCRSCVERVETQGSPKPIETITIIL